MKLYFSKGACSLAVRIIINEIGLSADFESVDLRAKTTATGKDFYTINEKGSVPVLELDNGEILTENAVILQYLADDSKAARLLPLVGDFERYRVLEWVNFITTELHKSFGHLFNPAMPQQVKDELLIPLIITKFNLVDKHLENHQYLMGDSFTLPDAYMFVMLLWASYFKMHLDELPHVSKYLGQLKQRDSIQKSLKDEGVI